MIRRMPGLIIVLLCLAADVRGVDIYVSPGGSDSNSGGLAAPFATLERARTEIRSLSGVARLQGGEVNVWLRGGVYTRTNTFELSAADAGTPVAPVCWRGYPGEEARVAGAVRLYPSWFSVVSNTSPVWSRIDSNAQGKVMQADLAAHGITNYGTLKVRGFGSSAVAGLELFFTNAPMPLARYPDPDQDEPAPTFSNKEITVFGDAGPLDVSGRYVTNGISDGVNCFKRVGLVNGKQYNLYRKYWSYKSSWFRAWFLTTSVPDAYPADTDPWWSRYTTELGPMNPAGQSGSTGTPRFDAPSRMSHGWMIVGTVTSANSFVYGGTRPQRWTQAEEPWFHGFWMYYWADQHQKAASISTNTGIITLGEAPGFGLAGGQPYYAENLLEEITRPGEWYLNRTKGILYFWPPAAVAGADIWVSMLEQPLWRLKDTTNIVVRDITFDMGRADLVALEGGMCNAYIHCVFRNAGGFAGRVSGFSNGVSSCSIQHPGEGGIALSGTGSRSSLIPVRNFVRNCDISDFSRWSWTYEPAALIKPETVGCLVSHNYMHDSPHTAVLFGRCNDNVVEFNRIANVCSWSSDAGAVYIGRDWGARGNIIRYNFIHDVRSTFEGFGTHGIYLDDCQSGVQVFGNIMYKVSQHGLMMGGGRDNLLENNIMVRCGSGIAADARGTTWMLAQGGSSKLWRDLQNYPYQSALWSNAYPRCAAIPNRWSAITNGTWLFPEGTVFSRNVGYSNAAWAVNSDNALAHFAEIADNLTNSNPLFVDEASLNLALQSNSPAFSIPGFKPIPFSSIGLESNLTLTVRTIGSGSVSAIPAQASYYPMQFVCLTAVPSNAFWRFDCWSGAVTGTSSTISVWMTNALDVTAIFRPYTTTNGTLH